MADTWRDKVGRVLAEALERPPEKRAAFLEERCEEEALRAEVASLLEAHEEASGLFVDLAPRAVASALGAWMEGRPAGEGSPAAEGASAEASDPLGLEGERIGGYDVEEHLGGGGMGVVYRARDVRLGRPVALKFLPPHLAMHPEADERFVREARAAAALEHPHVATIHEIGQTENARRYIAMAYYEGETLKQKIERNGAFPVEQAIRYAEQISEALSAAHEAGIVHRDVKPANVMVTGDGAVKLLDFGLAQAAAETRLTETGRQPGTAAYMSPEQARGEEVDPRTDLWALGALLYEMLTGERPFEGKRRTAILHAVLHDEPPSLAERRPEVSPTLAQVVHRCLEKNLENRYPSAEALRDDLRAVAAKESLASNGAQPFPTTSRDRFPRRWVIGGLALLLLAAIGAVGWALWSVGETEGAPPASTVAVLPFEVSGAGAETWRDGMVTALSLNLDGAAGLRAIADRTVFAAWEERGASDEGTSTESALGVARDVGAKYAIVGSAVQLGGELRLAAEVRRAATGERLGQVDVQRPPESMTALTDRLTRKVLGVLLEKSEDRLPSVNLASITTSSLEALKAFLEGERHLRSGGYEAAIEDYEGAVAEDSTFALAYARLGLCHGWLVTGKKRRYWQKAAELAGRLPRRERRIVRARNLRNDGRAVAAADSLRRLTAAYPDDPTTWYFLGETLYHYAVPRGLPEADTAFGRAIGLDPGMAPYHHHFVDMAFSVYRDSALAAKRLAQHPPSDFYKPMLAVAMDLVFGPPDQRQAALDSLEANPPTPFALHHPTDGDLWIQMLENWEPPVVQSLFWRLAGANFWHGHVREAYRRAEDRWAPGETACLLAYGSSLEMPVPDSLTRQYLAPERLPEDAAKEHLKCTGLYLVDHGHGERLAEVLGRLESKKGSEPLAEEVRGYRAFRAGNLQDAERLWAGHNESERVGAIWRGDLYRELGELRTAEGWYQAAWQVPLAHERLGRLYEKMGKPKKARVAYQRFIEVWKDADPQLQGRVETARERLDALRTEQTAE